MRQVLFHIPLTADWLPANVPLPLFLLALGLALGLAMWLISRVVRRPMLREGVRGAAFWMAVVGGISAAVVYFAAPKLPDGLPIYGFGMMLFLAFILCTWLAVVRAEREGIAAEHIQDLAIWLFIGGLIGARITFLVSETNLGWREMVSQIYKIWDGGIVLYGSVIGGLIAYIGLYWLSFRKHHLSTLKLADIVAPSIAVGLCLGRLGCFLNGCCYGQVACPTCPVYAVHFPLSAAAREGLVDRGYQTVAGFTLADDQPREYGVRVEQVDPNSDAFAAGLRPRDLIVKVNDCTLGEMEIKEDGRQVHRTPAEALSDCLGYKWRRGETDLHLTVRHVNGVREEELPVIAPRTLGLHPTQLYEVVSMILMFLLLMAYYPLRRHNGQVIAVLMAGYGIHRYLNELLRDDPRPKGFESYTSVFLVAAGIAMWIYLQRQPADVAGQKKEPPQDRNLNSPRRASDGAITTG